MTDPVVQPVEDICCHFPFNGSFEKAEPFGTGHINDTFCLTYRNGTKLCHYVLQRINRQVFPDPAAVMENILQVTRHIRHKLEDLQVEDIERRVLTVVHTKYGTPYYVDREGEYWRAYLRIEGAETFDVLNSLNQAYHAARGFGGFQYLLQDFPVTELHETIPRFHDGPSRYHALKHAVDTDRRRRVVVARPEIVFAQKHADIFAVVPRLLAAGDLPLRVTHNDTKINNVLLDSATGESVCVLDLDTVMPGVTAYDFGDIVRTSVSAAPEDETDLRKVVAEVPRFEALLKGYIDGTQGCLTPVEVDHLVHGAILITFIIGTRFLTDYLDGDRYYKVHHNGHNLERCRAQYKLVQSLMEQEATLQSLVRRMV